MGRTAADEDLRVSGVCQAHTGERDLLAEVGGVWRKSPLADGLFRPAEIIGHRLSPAFSIAAEEFGRLLRRPICTQQNGSQQRERAEAPKHNSF